MNQPRIRKTLPIHSVNERIQPVKSVAFNIAFIQPEGELVNVSRKMLGAGVVVDAM